MVVSALMSTENANGDNGDEGINTDDEQGEVAVIIGSCPDAATHVRRSNPLQAFSAFQGVGGFTRAADGAGMAVVRWV